MAEIQTHHALRNGFKTHPELTPYDTKMLTLIGEIKAAANLAKTTTAKADAARVACLDISNNICPVIDMVDDNDDEPCDTPGGRSTSSRRNATPLR